MDKYHMYEYHMYEYREIGFHQGYVWMTLLGSIMLGGLGVALAFSFEPTSAGNRLLGKSLGLFLVLFFSWLSATSWRKLVTGAPALVIDHVGIIDHTSVFRLGSIAWENISAVDVHHYQGAFLRIHLREPHTYHSSHPLAQFLNAGNIRMFQTISYIPTLMLKISNQELLASINDRREQHALLER